MLERILQNHGFTLDNVAGQWLTRCNDTNIQMTMKNLPIILVLLFIAGCQSAYYGALEKVGIHKRDVLVSRVEKANDSQQEAKEQFQSALEKFQAAVQFDGGEIEEIYSNLQSEYDESKALADEIRQRVEDIESVSEALFNEWEEELQQYTSRSLRQKSASQLTQTKQQYRKLITAMKKAESSMTPVLNVFKDQVLYLKHNLNAKAIASLKQELAGVQSNVSRLMTQMNASIAEADRFIKSMNDN